MRRVWISYGFFFLRLWKVSVDWAARRFQVSNRIHLYVDLTKIHVHICMYVLFSIFSRYSPIRDIRSLKLKQGDLHNRKLPLNITKNILLTKNSAIVSMNSFIYRHFLIHNVFLSSFFKHLSLFRFLILF